MNTKEMKAKLAALERFEEDVMRLWKANVDNEDDMTSDEAHLPLLNYLDEYFNAKRAANAQKGS